MTAGIFSNAFLCILGCTVFLGLSHAQLFQGSQHPDSTPYVRPLKNFGTSASQFTKEEQKVIDSELFTPPEWCNLYKIKVDENNVKNQLSKSMKCRPAYFGVNQTKLIGKIRQLKPITACDSAATTIETVHGDDEDATAIIAVAYRGECSFIQKARSAVKAGAKGLLIVDTVPSSVPTLLTLIATGEDENANVDIPVVSIMMEEKEVLSIPGFYFKLEFGNDMDWKKKENLYFWESLVEKYPHNPKYKMRMGKLQSRTSSSIHLN